jgi:hypothetical protein
MLLPLTQERASLLALPVQEGASASTRILIAIAAAIYEPTVRDPRAMAVKPKVLRMQVCQALLSLSPSCK